MPVHLTSAFVWRNTKTLKTSFLTVALLLFSLALGTWKTTERVSIGMLVSGFVGDGVVIYNL